MRPVRKTPCRPRVRSMRFAGALCFLASLLPGLGGLPPQGGGSEGGGAMPAECQGEDDAPALGICGGLVGRLGMRLDAPWSDPDSPDFDAARSQAQLDLDDPLLERATALEARFQAFVETIPREPSPPRLIVRYYLGNERAATFLILGIEGEFLGCLGWQGQQAWVYYPEDWFAPYRP